MLGLVKLVHRDKLPAFTQFAKQFVRDFHPTVNDAYVDKELQSYLATIN